MLSCQRDEFFLPAEGHYLNCAYTSPLSRRVEEAGIAGMRRKRTPASIAPSDFFAESDRARELFARLVNAPDASRVAVIPAVSYGVATVVRNTKWAAGQNVVVAYEQFPSNVHGWRRVSREEGVEIRTVAPPETAAGRGAGWNEAILRAIDASTEVVALGSVHWTDGTRFDLERIGGRAREVGAALVIDGTQSVGALPFDVQRVQPDALICAGYKWLMGPYGIGLAYYGPRYDGGTPLEETWLGRAGSEQFQSLVDYRDDYQPGAARFDVGQRCNFTLLPMLIAALEQLLEWGVSEIQEYCRALTVGLVEEAQALGFRVEEEAWRGSHLFGLRMPAGLDLSRVQALLQERAISASLRGSALRISPHVYNEPGDVEALIGVLRRAV